MDFEQMTQTWTHFSLGYAGRYTREIETKSLALAGRQDDFCVVCLRTLRTEELFPQLAAKEIHYCPRRFCQDCCLIDEHWRRESNRFEDSVYQNLDGFVAQTCLLCWKRNWDFVPPILGATNPAWQDVPMRCFRVVQMVRHEDWKATMVGEHKWRKALIACYDDMSLTSDRQLLLDIVNSLPKKNEKFLKKHGLKMLRTSLASDEELSGACTDHVFNTEKCFQLNFTLAHSVIGSTPPLPQYSNIALSHQGCEFHLNGAVLARNDISTGGEESSSLRRWQTENIRPPTNQRLSTTPTQHFFNDISIGYPATIMRTEPTMTGLEPEIDDFSDDESECVENCDEISHSSYAGSSNSSSDVALEDIDLEGNHPDPAANIVLGDADVLQRAQPSNLVKRKSQQINRWCRLRSGKQHLLALDSTQNLAEVNTVLGSSEGSPVVSNHPEPPRCPSEIEDNNKSNGELQVLSPYDMGNSHRAITRARLPPLMPALTSSSASEARMNSVSSSTSKPCRSTVIDEVSDELKRTEAVVAQSNADVLLKLSLYEATIARLEDEKEQGQSEIDQLKADLRAKAGLQANLDGMKQRYEHLSHQNQLFSSQITQLEADAANQDEKLNATHKQHAEELKMLNTWLDGRSFLYETLSGEYEVLMKKFAMVQPDLARLENDLTDKTRQHDLLQASYDRLERYCAEITTEKQSYEQKLQDVLSKNTELVASQNKSEERLMISGEHVKKLQKQLEAERDVTENERIKFQRDMANKILDARQVEEDLGNLMIEYMTCRRMSSFFISSVYTKLMTRALTRTALQKMCARPVIKAKLAQYEMTKSSSANRMSSTTMAVEEVSTMMLQRTNTTEDNSDAMVRTVVTDDGHPHKRARIS